MLKSTAVNAEALEALSAENARHQAEVALEHAAREACVQANNQFALLRVKGFRSLCATLADAADLGATSDAALDRLYVRILEVAISSLERELALPSHRQSGSLNGPLDCLPGYGLHQATQLEVTCALQTLQGLCLLHGPSKAMLSSVNFLKLVLAKVQQSLVFLPECLSVLLAVLLDNAPAQELFLQLQGLARVCQMLQDKTCPRHMRLECASFLLVLLNSMQQASGDLVASAASVVQGQMGQQLAAQLQQPLSHIDNQLAMSEDIRAMSNQIVTMVDAKAQSQK